MTQRQGQGYGAPLRTPDRGSDANNEHFVSIRNKPEMWAAGSAPTAFSNRFLFDEE